ncbi:hypothetical protein KVA01_11530 [Kocuria varians]|uniref:Nudix hydrolase domain-containing protein n=1 Tax=Kocuria varians TaxID=1272 RepID=A0A4Y4D1E2_KOCVA|nr:hypothetical protein [Kocuria varians]GEC98998.1 hypothetical protein KVA01_11530 [Kocuria varians]
MGAAAQGERIFAIPPSYSKAARAWMERGLGLHAATPRRGAATVFVRDGDNGVETLMIHRPGRQSMGTLSFPGGITEPSDDEPLDWRGPSSPQWAHKLLSEDIGQARRSVVTAARKTFVETGILFAGAPMHGVAENVEGVDWMRSREQLATQDLSFAELLDKRSMAFHSECLRPLSHWMTSDFVHQRVDLQFFAAAVPVGQKESPLATQRDLAWLGWVDARTLLEDPWSTAVPELFRDESQDSAQSEDPWHFDFNELTTPGVQCAVEAVAEASSALAFLAARRDLRVKVPRLDLRDNEPVLVLDA